MVELGANPFIPRIFQMFDLNKDGMITLDEFTKAIEMFGQLGSEEEQYKCESMPPDRNAGVTGHFCGL
eukprot:356114-Chlamydomonas_euryale.AAC.7